MADSPTILTWTPANWLTVLLMVFLGFFAIGTAVKIFKQRQAGG